jgi:predicted GNAT family acetyltransferase
MKLPLSLRSLVTFAIRAQRWAMSEPAKFPVPVRHNLAEHRFEADVDGHLSVAEYEKRNGTLVFTHTFVPPELRGRGVAEALVRSGLEFAKEQNVRVVPACSYVARFIERHREYQSRLA